MGKLEGVDRCGYATVNPFLRARDAVHPLITGNSDRPVFQKANFLLTKPCHTQQYYMYQICTAVKKFQTQGFINASKLSFDQILHRPRWTLCTPLLPLHLRPILIFSSHLHFAFQVVFFLQIFWQKLCMRFTSTPFKLHAPPIHSLSLNPPANVQWRVQTTTLLVM